MNERNGRVGASHDVLKTCRFALGPKNVHQPWALAPSSLYSSQRNGLGRGRRRDYPRHGRARTDRGGHRSSAAWAEWAAPGADGWPIPGARTQHVAHLYVSSFIVLMLALSLRCSQALIAHQNEVYAIDATCYHMGGPLLHADIEDHGSFGACVVCPWHSYPISLRTGESVYHNLSGATCSKGLKQRVHEVVRRDGRILVRLASSPEKVESDTYAFKTPPPSGGGGICGGGSGGSSSGGSMPPQQLRSG